MWRAACRNCDCGTSKLFPNWTVAGPVRFLELRLGMFDGAGAIVWAQKSRPTTGPDKRFIRLQFREVLWTIVCGGARLPLATAAMPLDCPVTH
jgi:hypothetical protein